MAVAADAAAAAGPATGASAAEPASTGAGAWLVMVGLAAAFAVPAAIVAALFIVLVRVTTDLAWTTIPAALGLPDPVVVLAVPISLALVVGLIIRFAPGHGGPDPVGEHGLGGHAGTLRELPGTVAAAVASLASGASLGPEGPLVGILGTVGAATARRLRLPPEAGRLLGVAGLAAVLGVIFGNPLAVGLFLLELSPSVGRELYRRVVPALVAATVGVYIADAVAGGPFLHLEFPVYPGLEAWHLAAAVLIGAGGGAVGLLYTEGTRALRRVLAPVEGRPILRVLVGGVAVGVVALVAGPLTLFSGEHELGEVLARGEAIGTVGLLGLAGAKAVAASFSLSTGFRGGRIFPILFIGGTLGMALHVAVPAVPAALAAACGMAGTGIALFRYPLFLTALVVVFTSPDVLPLVLLAAVAGWVVVESRPEL